MRFPKTRIFSLFLCVVLFTNLLVPAFAYSDSLDAFSTESMSVPDLMADVISAKGIPLIQSDICSQEPITRMDAAVVLAWMVGYGASDKTYVCPFSDVSEEYQSYVGCLYQNGVMAGIGGGLAGVGELTLPALKIMLCRILNVSEDTLSFVLPQYLGTGILTVEDFYLSVIQVLFHPYTSSRIPAACTVNREASFDRVGDVYIDPASYRQALTEIEFACWFLPDRIFVVDQDNSAREDSLKLFNSFVNWYASKRGYVYGGSELPFSKQTGDVYGGFSPSLSYDKSLPGAENVETERAQIKALYKSGKLSTYDYVLQHFGASAPYAYTPTTFSLRCEFDDSWKALVAASSGFSVYKDSGHESAVEELARTFLASSLSQHDYIKWVNQWLVDNAGYDRSDSTYDGEDEAHYIVGYTTNKLLVCDGYSNVFKFAMSLAGYDSVVVYGKGLGKAHAWNKVKVGGQWYNVDVTWNDSFKKADKYLLKSDSYFASNDHAPQSYSGAPYSARYNN